MSEKRKATYDLDAFKASFANETKLALTKTALQSATDLGFSRAEMIPVLQSMQRDYFYKSMTSHTNHQLWQDVYHVPSTAGVLYVKFTADAVTEYRLLSFKEKDNE